MSAAIYLIVILLVLIVYRYWRSWKHPDNFPPGPRRPLPIFGDAYILGKDSANGFYSLHKKYGKVFGMWLGQNQTVVVSDFELLQDILNKPEYSFREDPPAMGMQDDQIICMYISFKMNYLL